MIANQILYSDGGEGEKMAVAEKDWRISPLSFSTEFPIDRGFRPNASHQGCVSTFQFCGS
jgi:hypothetical protein